MSKKYFHSKITLILIFVKTINNQKVIDFAQNHGPVTSINFTKSYGGLSSVIYKVGTIVSFGIPSLFNA